MVVSVHSGRVAVAVAQTAGTPLQPFVLSPWLESRERPVPDRGVSWPDRCDTVPFAMYSVNGCDVEGRRHRSASRRSPRQSVTGHVAAWDAAKIAGSRGFSSLARKSVALPQGSSEVGSGLTVGTETVVVEAGRYDEGLAAESLREPAQALACCGPAGFEINRAVARLDEFVLDGLLPRQADRPTAASTPAPSVAARGVVPRYEPEGDRYADTRVNQLSRISSIDRLPSGRPDGRNQR